MQIFCTIYSKNNVGQFKKKILEYIDSLNAINSEFKFKKFKYAKPWRYFEKLLYFDQFKSILETTEDISYIFMDNLPKNAKRGHVAENDLLINFDKSEESELVLNGPKLNYISNAMDLSIISQKPDAINKWINAHIKLFEQINGLYGFIEVDDLGKVDHYSIASGATYKLSDKWKDDAANWYSNSSTVNTKVRGAYLGNFFNSTHLDKLGGIEKVKDWAIWERWDDLENGGGLGMLIADPTTFNEGRLDEKSRELANLLQPVLM